jgi:hypothetical protein
MKSLRFCSIIWLFFVQLCASSRVRRRSNGHDEDPVSLSALDHPHRELQELQVVVGSFGTPWGPLERCQGDCDVDTECRGDLKCFQRVANEPVPGCLDESSGSNRFGMDFCYDEKDAQNVSAQSLTTTSTTSTTLPLNVIVGILVSPANGTLLGKCEGDCDWDSECASGLECFYRSDNSPVPGCYGDTASKFSYDFCYDPNDKFGEPVGAQPVASSPMLPAQPFSIPTLMPTLAPQLPMSSAPLRSSTNSPATATVSEPAPPAASVIPLQVIVGVGAALPSGQKLGKCQGDCDSDYECAAGLLCRQRADDSPVPGCIGEGIGFRTGIDFCYDPADAEGADAPQVTPQNPPVAPSPTSVQVPSSPPANAPTQQPVITSIEDMTLGTNFLEIIGDSNQTNVPRCKGDCDRDENCLGEFVCYQKYSRDSYVPGCFGLGEDLMDYCIDPRDDPTNIHRDRFRLKMFWRTGYKWQEQTLEQKWCIECAARVCSAGGGLVISICDDDGSNEEFHLVFRNGFELSVQVAGTDLCFEAPAATLPVVLQPCNSGKPEQRFRPGIGDWDWDRFELETVAAPGCITQRHHPKEGEPLYREDCEVARNDRTSLWNKYL